MITSFHAPTVYENTPGGGMRAWTIESKLLETERTIFVNGAFNDVMADQVIKQLMYLKSLSTDDVTMYINSPGGVVTAGMAMYDAMQQSGCKISTIVMGLAASMGSFILMAGTKGKRFAMPNAEIMIHQPSGGAQGQASDIERQARHILKTKARMTELYAHHCGGVAEEWEARLDRDTWLTAEEALKFGLIDGIVGQETAK